MKILLLVEDIVKISQLLRQNNNFKVIDEYEMVEETPYKHGLVQPKYSDYVIDRARVFSIIYNYSKTLCLIIDQRHKNAIDKIPHDVSIRICKNIKPRRLSDSFTQTVNKTIIEKELDLETLFKI
jgi:uncharacterized phage-like protein YoqJ